MKLKLAVVLFALAGIGLTAAPSPSSAQVREMFEKARRGEQKPPPQAAQEQKPPPQAAQEQKSPPQAAQSDAPRSIGKKAKGKGKGKAYAKGQNK